MKQIIYLIEKILNNKSTRLNNIKLLQEIIWDSDLSSSVLSELAYDLDFYEPNLDFKKEDTNYYGDDELEEMLNRIMLLIQNNTNI